MILEQREINDQHNCMGNASFPQIKGKTNEKDIINSGIVFNNQHGICRRYL
jgi:hypothetical protein